MHQYIKAARWLPLFFLFLSSSTFAAAHTSGNAGTFEMLERLDPARRAAVLEAIGDSSGIESQRPIVFPDLVKRVGGGTQKEVALGQQLYLPDGAVLRDEEGNPVVLTEELLDGLKIDGPKQWLASDIPFFWQKIELRPFGYELFAGVPTTFAPATDIPVPNEYRLGPGDTVEVQLFGNENRQYSLVVNRDGAMNFPNIGPVNVMGQSFQELKQEILDRVSTQLIGVSASVTMGSLRSIQVLVLGDARRPGSYTISGLSTITNALFLSGGIKDIGSLRNIQLKRDGKLIKRLDLYDLLIKGDTSKDIRLYSGDVIFVPPVGKTVGVGGFVNRPAIYELLKESTVGEVIKMAGGLRPVAYPQGARIERISAEKVRSYINLDVSDRAGLDIQVQAGDVVLVPPVLREFEDGVQLLGNVKRPGGYQWFDGIRLTDVIADVGLLKPQSDINYVLIRRENTATKRISAVSANLAVAIENPSSKENIFLLKRDQISVFDLTPDRSVDVKALLRELYLQSSPGHPVERMIISGSVRAPGEFPYEQGMTAGDLVRAAGGLIESAHPFEAELTRRVLNDSGLSSKIILVDIGRAVDGDPLADIALEASDTLLIKRKENWRSEGKIDLIGEVRFPGRYSFSPGESLFSVLERAGGLTEQAFAGGSIFLRRALQEREQKQIQELRERIQGDLAALALQSARSIEGGAIAEATGAGAALLSSLNAADATGRLVIDLERVLAGSGSENYQVFLKPGDRLLVPDKTQAVTVIGEVQFPTSHLFEKSLSRNDYILRSGGIAPNGTSKDIYIVKANGRVVATGSRWFRGSNKVEAGDTIVVPLDVTRGLRLKAWASATTILYNTAIAVAAINGLSN